MTADASRLRQDVRAYAERLAAEAAGDLAAQVRDRIGRLELWDYTTRPRKRFDPHFVLHGAEVDGRDDDLLVNPNSWPPGSHYFPQDHKGCLCRLRSSPRTVKASRTGAGATVRWVLESRAPAIGGIRVGQRRVTITRSDRPAWFDEIVNAESWTEALRRAQGRVRG